MNPNPKEESKSYFKANRKNPDPVNAILIISIRVEPPSSIIEN